MSCTVSNVYVTLAHRFGDYELHSYIVGVSTTKDLAVRLAEEEADFRGGKYGCVVREVQVDLPFDEATWAEQRIIYKTREMS